jgi:hypothetical protein
MQKKQQGATIWVNLVWIIMGVIVAIVGVKLTPIYLDNFTVAGALDGLKSEPDLSKMKDKDIYKVLYKHFVINSVRTIGQDKIKIERNKKQKDKLVAVNIDYEIREHLFYNVDVILTFNNRLDVQDVR